MIALSPKRERFCQEYVIDSNATQAATRAGYSAKTAQSQGPRLFGFVEIKKRIDELRAELSVKRGITIESVIEEFNKDRTSARKNKNQQSAIKATIEIAKLHGLYEEHNKQKRPEPSEMELVDIFSRIEELKSILNPSQNITQN